MSRENSFAGAGARSGSGSFLGAGGKLPGAEAAGLPQEECDRAPVPGLGAAPGGPVKVKPSEWGAASGVLIHRRREVGVATSTPMLSRRVWVAPVTVLVSSGD